MKFAAAAAELRRAEIARLGDAIVPRLETMRRMTPEIFRACSNGHMVVPTIARAMLLPPRPIGWKPGEDAAKPAPRPYSRREIRAHNAKYEARMMKTQRPGR